MSVTVDQIKQLRELTGAGMMDCKQALVEAANDLERARDILRQRGLAEAQKRAGRVTQEGVIGSYVHSNGKLAALVEVCCETDFVARTEEFQNLAHDLAMQVASMRPEFVSPDDIPAERLETERRIFEEMTRQEGKPEQALPKIVEGRLRKLYTQICLLDQPYIKDEKGKKNVRTVVDEARAKLGENIVVRRFVRLQLGEDAGEA